MKYDSIRKASKALGIAEETLRTAKALGCPSFRAFRVYDNGLKEWLETNKDLINSNVRPTQNLETYDSLRKKKLTKEIAKLELQVEKLKNAYVSRDEVANYVHGLALSAQSLLRKYFENELPAKLVGLSTPEIQIRCREAIDSISEVFQRKPSDWQ
jgi:DNA-binding MurR/RpiR family transcriptional regulator